jgi:signal transduction histidine kinase
VSKGSSASGERSSLERQLDVERGLVKIRWFGAVFALFEIFVQTGDVPAYVKRSGYGMAGALALFNLGLMLRLRRERDLPALRRAGAVAFVVDHLFVIGLTWVYSFSQIMTQWVILCVLPMEAAVRYGIGGVLASLGAIAAAEVGRDFMRLYEWHYRPALLSSTTFRVGVLSIVGVLAGVMARNLDHERRLEQKARREVEELLSREQEAVERLTELDAMRSDFIAITSHELRTPLTAIRGFVATMRRAGPRLSDSERAEYLEVVDRQSRKLTAIVEDLHFLAGVEAQSLLLRLRPLDVGTVVAGLVREDFAPQAARIRVEGPECAVEVVADEDRLRRALGAVIGNALRFSPPEAPVDVTVQERDGGAVIEVRDRGPGIPQEELERIFDPFHQVGGAMKRRQEGFGLGLYVTRRLLEAMQGSVTVRTTLGEGSVFVITLRPASEPEGVNRR